MGVTTVSDYLVLNTEHADFDESMELLCLLRPAPHFAPADMVTSDLRLEPNSGQLAKLRKDLMKLFGVRIISSGAGGGDLAIDPRHAEKATRLAEGYWDTVYQAG
jgi:hypothetical protein